MERLPLDGAELEQWALNGANNWHQYSWGGCPFAMISKLQNVFAPHPNSSANTAERISQTAGKRGSMCKPAPYIKQSNASA